MNSLIANMAIGEVEYIFFRTMKEIEKFHILPMFFIIFLG